MVDYRPEDFASKDRIDSIFFFSIDGLDWADCSDGSRTKSNFPFCLLYLITLMLLGL